MLKIFLEQKNGENSVHMFSEENPQSLLDCAVSVEHLRKERKTLQCYCVSLEYMRFTGWQIQGNVSNSRSRTAKVVLLDNTTLKVHVFSR